MYSSQCRTTVERTARIIDGLTDGNLADIRPLAESYLGLHHRISSERGVKPVVIARINGLEGRWNRNMFAVVVCVNRIRPDRTRVLKLVHDALVRELRAGGKRQHKHCSHDEALQ